MPKTQTKNKSKLSLKKRLHKTRKHKTKRGGAGDNVPFGGPRNGGPFPVPNGLHGAARMRARAGLHPLPPLRMHPLPPLRMPNHNQDRAENIRLLNNEIRNLRNSLANINLNDQERNIILEQINEINRLLNQN
jgi:hypothetical protein